MGDSNEFTHIPERGPGGCIAGRFGGRVVRPGASSRGSGWTGRISRRPRRSGRTGWARRTGRWPAGPVDDARGPEGAEAGRCPGGAAPGPTTEPFFFFFGLFLSVVGCVLVVFCVVVF